MNELWEDKSDTSSYWQKNKAVQICVIELTNMRKWTNKYE
jgi:hypothetical protein